MYEIINFYPHQKGALIGYFDVKDHTRDEKINGCALFQKDGKMWATTPRKGKKNDNGEIVFSAVIEYGNTRREEFSKGCSIAYKAFLEAKQSSRPHTFSERQREKEEERDYNNDMFNGNFF